MKLLRMSIVVSMLLVRGTWAQVPPVQDALDGVDPVVLIQEGKEVTGKPDLQIVRNGFRYLFSTPETKAAFEREPAKYELQFGGSCARMGPGVRGNPSDFLVHQGKIYVFGSDECHKRFAEAPQKYLPPTPAPMPSSRAARAEGRRLIDTLVAGLGGASHLDGLTSYLETATQVVTQPQGEIKITTRKIWRFPGGVRVEVTRERAGAAGPATTMTMSTVLTPATAWAEAPQQRLVLPQVMHASMQAEQGRHPVALLRARGSKEFTVASLGATTIEGTPVEQVRVQYRGVDVTLGMEAKSRRLHSASFVDRNKDGYGQVTLIYSDFRDVDGLMLPHQVRGLFNGQEDPFRTSSIQAVTLNAPVDASLFTPPSGGGK